MITLETLPQATAQEVFDQVATHLLTQRQRSTTKGNCAYRGDDGLKCAAGCLLGPDDGSCYVVSLVIIQYTANSFAVGWGLAIELLTHSSLTTSTSHQR
jgi:hypothetical protein